MRKRVAIVVMFAVLSMVCNLPAYAATLNVDGLEMDVPDAWTETEREEGEDGSVKITYSCGEGYMSIWTAPYDASIMADMSYVLLDAGLYGIQKTEGYTEVDSSNVSIAGETAHSTVFSYDGKAGILVSVDTGISIANFLYMCPLSNTDEFDEFAEALDGARFVDSTGADSVRNVGAKTYTKYTSDFYKVGSDIPVGEYMIFAEGGHGYFCVSADSNQDDITFNDNFDYNSIVTVNDGEYLELSDCHAIPFEESPDVELTGSGMFKIGTHIPAGEYKLEATGGHGYYCIYPDSRQDDIISNDNFESQNYVTVSDGQYLVLSGCKFSETPEKPMKTYSDAETVLKVQEALNVAGYDCGTPDGIAGSGTKGQIEKYQTDKGLTVTGTITDEVLESLGI